MSTFEEIIIIAEQSNSNGVWLFVIEFGELKGYFFSTCVIVNWQTMFSVAGWTMSFFKLCIVDK